MNKYSKFENQEDFKENCDNNKNPIFLKWVEKIKTITCVWLLSVWLVVSWNSVAWENIENKKDNLSQINKNLPLEEKIENILLNLDERIREYQRKKIKWFNPVVSKELVECIEEAEKIITDKSDKNKMKLTITLITFFWKVDTIAWSSNEYYEIVIEKFPELKWTELWKKLNSIANDIVILNLQKKLNRI